jgi:hypothetical protein
VKRREFITLLGGAVAWPIATPAQPERVRRIGVLLPASANDNAFQDRIGAFLQGLQQSGWTIGGNVRIDTRWATNNPNEIRRHAAELAALAPDVVVAFAASTVGAMLHIDRAYLQFERRRCGLNNTELGRTAGCGRIAKNRRARHAWCDLLEQLKQFPRHAVLEQEETRRVAPRASQAVDEPGSDRIGDAWKHDRHRARRL